MLSNKNKNLYNILDFKSSFHHNKKLFRRVSFIITIKRREQKNNEKQNQQTPNTELLP